MSRPQELTRTQHAAYSSIGPGRAVDGVWLIFLTYEFVDVWESFCVNPFQGRHPHPSNCERTLYSLVPRYISQISNNLFEHFSRAMYFASTNFVTKIKITNEISIEMVEECEINSFKSLKVDLK